MTPPTKTHRDLHIPRKLFHFCTVFAIFLCIVSLSTRTNWMIYLFVGMPLLAFDFSRQFSEKANRAAMAIGGFLLRQTEFQRLSGASFAIISVGLVYFIFPFPIAALSVLFLAVGDPIASFFGLLYGKTKIFKRKSLEGFLAAWVSCSLAAMTFLYGLSFESNVPWVVATCCGFFGAVAELVPVGSLDDNLSQPLISSGLMALLFTFFEGVM